MTDRPTPLPHTARARRTVDTDGDTASSHDLPPKPARQEVHEGLSWVIEERFHAGVWSLIFSADSVTRRVWHYPANWRQLDRSALFALTHSRAAILRRVTSQG